MRSPVLDSLSQAAYSINATKSSSVEVSKQRTPVAGLGTERQPQNQASFIRTVPMQHVQSHYAEQQYHQAPDEQLTASMQRLLPDKAWLTQLTTPAFMPLIGMSPESSCSSICQEPRHCQDSPSRV